MQNYLTLNIETIIIINIKGRLIVNNLCIFSLNMQRYYAITVLMVNFILLNALHI